MSAPGPSGGPSGAVSGGSGASSNGGSDRWYFTRDQLAASPSRRCGIDADKELAYRQQAASLIQDMGQRLQVSQLCINTAIVYMHRFYAFHSFTQFHRNATAAAALFLAAKVEEQPRKLEHVIKVAHICLHRGEGQAQLDTQSRQYQDQAQELVFNENVLLQTLGFDVAIDHPHTHVVRLCNLVSASKDLAQTSYFMASNSLHLTTMCLQYRPTVVACFCIHLASKWSNWAIPPSSEGKNWFYYVDRTVTSDLLEHLTAEFLHIFDRCPARLKKKIMSITGTQGKNCTNSPQQANSSHSNIPPALNSNYDKDIKKPILEDVEKIESDKRQNVFGSSGSSTVNQMNSNKVEYREYKERQQQQQQQQQDRRRPPNVPPSNMIPRPPQDMSGGSQSRQSSGGQRPPNIPPSQHRWPSNHRSKEVVSMRPHPYPSSSSSSSRPPHRNSSSTHHSQMSSSSQSMQPLPEQKSRNQHLPHQPSMHSSRVHSQPSHPIQQLPQQTSQQSQHQIHQPPPQLPQQNMQIPIQQPAPRPPSLFSPEPQRKPSVPRRPPIKETSLPIAPLSPLSSPIPPSRAPLEIEPVVIKKEEEPPPVEVQVLPPLPTNSVETDPTLVSSLLKESLSHKSEKKKKKDKHKHKDKDKREEKRKNKKDKDKDKKRELESNPVSVASSVPSLASQSSVQMSTNPLKITIPREALTNTTPSSTAKLKIKIPKDRIRTEPPVPVQNLAPAPTALKIKIPKEVVENSRKRSSPAGVFADMIPHKTARLPQQTHQHHKVSHELQQPTRYMAPPPPLMMMYPQQPPPVMMYSHHHPPSYYYPQNTFFHPPPAAAPPLPPTPPPPPPPPPP